MREHKEIGSKPVSYYYLRNKNLIIGTTMRAASSSMHTVLEKGSTITQERVVQLRDSTPVIIWLRHPLTRFASAYYLFRKNRSFSEFIHHATTVRNTHWLPQTTIHSYKDQFLPIKVFPFSDLAKTWEDIVGISLPHLKKSKNRDELPDLIKRADEDMITILSLYYQRDLKLYRKLNVYTEDDL